MNEKETTLNHQLRHGYTVLCIAGEDTPIGSEILELEELGKLTVAQLEPLKYDVTKESGLEGYTVRVLFRIDSTPNTGDQSTYIGNYIGEELQGGINPLLLLPPDAVYINNSH